MKTRLEQLKADACEAAERKIEDNSWLPYIEKKYMVGFMRKTKIGCTYFWAEKTAEGSE